MKIDLKNLKSFENFAFLANQLVDGFISGLHRSPYHGFSVEFAEHKLYNEGESIKNIDWKVYGRTERLYTKQYQEETNLRCRILIDNSASMHYPIPEKSKIKFACMAAACLANLLTKQRDVVGLTTFSDKIEYESAQKSTRTHLSQLIDKLSSLPQDEGVKSTDIAQVIHQVASTSGKRSLFIIFTDMMQTDNKEEIFNALQHLKHKKHEVLLFHVSDHKTELEFDFADRTQRFIDIETNEKIELNPAEIRDNYRKTVAEYYNEIKLRCGGMKIDFIHSNTEDSFDKILVAYLIKRQKVR